MFVDNVFVELYMLKITVDFIVFGGCQNIQLCRFLYTTARRLF